MTKRVKAKKKVSRSSGVSLWGRANDPFKKKNFKPGQHSSLSRRETSYSLHLRAKQRIRRYYNIREEQFKTLFLKARRAKGNTEDLFAGMLESRLATIVYRANIAPTIYAARQLVSHKHILVNDKPINISSYQVNVGDVVKVAEKARNIALITDTIEAKEKEIPGYLEVNPDEMTAKLLNRPSVADIPYPFETEYNLLVEFYSR